MCEKNRVKEYIKQKYMNKNKKKMTDEQKQKYKDYQK